MTDQTTQSQPISNNPQDDTGYSADDLQKLAGSQSNYINNFLNSNVKDSNQPVGNQQESTLVQVNSVVGQNANHQNPPEDMKNSNTQNTAQFQPLYSGNQNSTQSLDMVSPPVAENSLPSYAQPQQVSQNTNTQNSLDDFAVAQPATIEPSTYQGTATPVEIEQPVETIQPVQPVPSVQPVPQVEPIAMNSVDNNVNLASNPEPSPYQTVNQVPDQNDSQPNLNISANNELTQSTAAPYTAEPMIEQSQLVDAVPVNSMPSQVVEPAIIETQTQQISHDYADNYNISEQTNSQSDQPVQTNMEPTQLGTNSFNVISDFSENTSQQSSITTSTNVMQSFDDSSDDLLAPMPGDDSDALDDDLDDTVSLMPYGFSDYDPVEESQGTANLGDFESQSLEEVAGNFDADFSDNFQVQGGMVQLSNPIAQNNYTEPVVKSVEDTAHQDVLQIEPKVNGHAQDELTPAARLNKLLEAEEAAENMVMQKQNNFVAQKTPKRVENPSNSIFKTLESDADFRGEMSAGMKKTKSTHKYFLIISLIIIISVIGFLLVLLGLTLI